MNKKSIVIYFSRADENYAVGYVEKGNTEIIAEYIKDITDSDIFKVNPMIPYSANYESAIEDAKERQLSHNAPIVESLPDLTNYEVVYIGSPVYWGYMPEEMITALKDVDFKDKTVRIFITHEGSLEASIPSQVKEVCNGADVLTDALVIRGSYVKSSRKKVEDWLKS